MISPFSRSTTRCAVGIQTLCSLRTRKENMFCPHLFSLCVASNCVYHPRLCSMSSLDGWAKTMPQRYSCLLSSTCKASNSHPRSVKRSCALRTSSSNDILWDRDLLSVLIPRFKFATPYLVNEEPPIDSSLSEQSAILAPWISGKQNSFLPLLP